jgi:hypothetical protein
MCRLVSYQRTVRRKDHSMMRTNSNSTVEHKSLSQTENKPSTSPACVSNVKPKSASPRAEPKHESAPREKKKEPNW